jgi:hypothetical protein
LTQPTYSFNGGKFQLEAKDEIKKRLGTSPDLADALALTFAIPDQPARGPWDALKNRGRIAEHEYDPLA